ncbi:hypothetical protein [Micromonospora sp. NPDC050695]|uniref:hypothetical protein n=1 Tax=Micromonospora sp. NPDC050695 TaxID=3154938 RepID=UPI0033E2D168
MKTYTTVTNASDVTDEILDAATSIYDGWHSGDNRIRWDDLIDRLDGSPLADGTSIDLGNDMASAAIKKIKQHVSAYRKS